MQPSAQAAIQLLPKFLSLLFSHAWLLLEKGVGGASVSTEGMRVGSASRSSS
jgi:hypothetical protein